MGLLYQQKIPSTHRHLISHTYKLTVTGALAIYEKAETWMAADEKLFTIDHENGKWL